MTTVLNAKSIGILVFAVVSGLLIGSSIGLYTVESGSMEPTIMTDDQILVTHVGVAELTSEGSIIIYEQDDPDADSKFIIHRTVYYTEAGENWVQNVDPQYLSSTSCTEIENCPAPNDGYITHGDANEFYDQSSGISKPVNEERIKGYYLFKFNLPDSVIEIINRISI